MKRLGLKPAATRRIYKAAPALSHASFGLKLIRLTRIFSCTGNDM